MRARAVASVMKGAAERMQTAVTSARREIRERLMAHELAFGALVAQGVDVATCAKLRLRTAAEGRVACELRVNAPRLPPRATVRLQVVTANGAPTVACSQRPSHAPTTARA